MEPKTCADQVLAQITEGQIIQIDTIAPAERAHVRVCKSRGVVERMVFDERAKLRCGSSSKNAISVSSACTNGTLVCSLIVALLIKDGAYSLLIEPQTESVPYGKMPDP